ncbi:hypothetical protein [Pseudescherichia sp.]|uniref:hypothetical protein n=1 Tax=Pseudescherichia sp. TaxID=2055881 RepID=UPI0026D9AB02|nr:hypothetical protein [Pseudescherichia sp.]
MCSIIIHYNVNTGCLCTLNEKGEFTLATTLTGCKVLSGDLLSSNMECYGQTTVLNLSSNLTLDIDIKYRTRSEAHAVNLLQKMTQ